MTKTITFNELRSIKDKLPSGSIKKIADRLQMKEDTIRNYFGASHYQDGKSVGIHVEQGPDGGIVTLDDTKIYDAAIEIIEEEEQI